MRIQINHKKKKELTKLAGTRKKSVCIVGKIEHILYFISVFGTLLFVIVALTNKQMLMEEVRGVVRKQYFFVSLYATIIFSVTLFWGVLAHFLKLNLQSANTEERIDEKLVLTEENLVYSFRIKYQSRANDRLLVLIPLDKIQKIDNYQNEGKLSIWGTVMSDYREVSQLDNLENLQDSYNGEFIIYDYFRPSLLECLKKSGLTINNK